MRILVDSGEHQLVDKGRIARIEVTLARLRELWPDAEIGLLTDQLTQANLFFPGVTPVPYTGPGGWPDGVHAGLLKMSGPELGLDGTPLARGTQSLRGSIDTDPPALRTAPRGVADADLIVSAARSDLSDLTPEEVDQTLGILEAALRAGRRVAMFGQAFGPLEHPELASRAAAILPRLEMITVREGVRSPRALGLLGVPADRITITGDDAFELVADNRVESEGLDLGINLQIATYTALDSPKAAALGAAIRQVADENAAHLSPIYISEYNDEDRLGTLKLVGDYPLVRPDYSRYAHPSEVAQRVGRCRVLVTSAHNAAVFALAQGVPVVCLPRSDYDLGGFDGLAALFPMGCRIIPLNTPRMGDALRREISALWAAGPALRSSLISIASDHIAEGQAAYIRLHNVIEGAAQLA